MKWKIIATIIIIVLILYFGTSMSPLLGKYVDSAKSRITGMFGAAPLKTSSPVAIEVRNINFTLAVDNYPFISTTGASLDIYVQSPNLLMLFQDGAIESNDSVKLINYSGMVAVNATQLSLDGSVQSLMSDKLVFAMKGKLKTSAIFSNLVLENISLGELSLDNVTGYLVIGDTETQINAKSVVIKSPSGKFAFGENTSMTVEGSAKSISIPEAGIEIR